MISVGILVENSMMFTSMDDIANILKEYDVSCETISVETKPYLQWVKEFEDQGGKVIIAGVSHNPSFLTELCHTTSLPVIKVPISLERSEEGEISTQQLFSLSPKLPIATVAINGTRNAALLAIGILALSDSRLRDGLIRFRTQMKEEVEQKDLNLQTILS